MRESSCKPIDFVRYSGMRFSHRWSCVPVLLCGLLAFGLGGCASPGSISPERLTCEMRENPEGIPATRPRLAWRLKGEHPDERGVFMQAYRVVAASSADMLDRGPLVWDSGRVARSGDELLATRAEWGGEPLRSRDKVWWRVKVWDQEGRESAWSPAALFSVGLLDGADWKAEWIGLEDAAQAPLTAEVRDELRRMPWVRLAGGPERHERVAYFRKEFELLEGRVSSAWLAGTADMAADVLMNGRPAAQLARWEFARPIDVKSVLVAGTNAVGVRVENHDGFNPAVTGMLVVTFTDGREQRVPIDGSWKMTEKVEAMGGWNRAGFDDSAWGNPEVAGGAAWGASRNTEHFMPRAPFLRTVFATQPGKVVKRATLYATALGLYECRLNGAKVGGDEFAPGWTEYAKRVEHRTYDVTPMVRAGGAENCLGAVLGDGWYAGLMGYTGQRRFYHRPARFMGQLEIEYGDGTKEIVATGPGWKASFGPVLHTDNYLGSEVDSRLVMNGWDSAGFDASAWRTADVGLASGSAGREADVTERVASAVTDGRVSLEVGPGTLGDPAYGVVKRLRVEYTTGGIAHEISLKEGKTLVLPRPGEQGPLAIVRASFGEPPQPPAPPFVVEPAMGEPVKRFEELPTKKVSEPLPGRYVFDLGQNMVGWARLSVNGSPGQRLVVRHAEMLNPDGTLYTSNLRGAIATDVYTLRGGLENLEPPFTFHGFRYVEVTGLSSPPPAGMVTGVVAHTAMRPAGTFETSNPLLNQLVQNIVWGQKGNYFEVPTDCPQRDERLGWTGDAQFFIKTAAYNFDVSSFMERWLKTLDQDAQMADGTLAHVAPKVREPGGSTAWGDAGIVCTHAVYTAYGDTRVIRNNYDAMKRYMAWLDTKTRDGIAKVGGFGDWLNLGDPTPNDLIDTAYRAELCRLMGEMAGAIGKTEDAQRFKAAREATVAAFRARFLSVDGTLKGSGQTGYALAFTMGLIPDDLRQKASEKYAAAIEKKNGHLATGFIGTPRLLPGLYNAGLANVAGRLLLNEDYPSWLYQVHLGATTMWERWDGWTPERGFQDVGMNSFNHYAFGSVGDYLYRHVAGIAPLAPGYARVQVAPTPTAGLDHAAASYDSVAGVIKSAWRRVGDGVEYTIAIPANTRAEIRLPLPRSDASVTEGGRTVETAGGLSGVRLASSGSGEPVMRMDAVSGTYRFVVK